jgi:hypothetical protein
MLDQKRRQKIGLLLLVFAAYIVAAVVTTWPLAAHMGSHLPGASDDRLVHYWNGWWVQKALSTGQSPLYSPYLYYPVGASLVTHNVAWLNVLPWLLLEPLLGGILAYNVVLLAYLALCGLAAFLLAHRVTGDPRAAFVAGIIYLAWPFRLSQLDHPNLVTTQWVPLFVLFLLLTIREGRWRYGLLTGLFFALAGYTRWQQLIPVTLMGLTCFVCAAPRWARPDRRYVLSRLLLAAVVAGIALLSPVLLLLGQMDEGGDAPELVHYKDEWLMQTDALAYATPPGWHPVLGKWTEPFYDRYYADRSYHRRYPAYIGLVALLLAIVGVKYRGWKSLPWVAMALMLIALALGPTLRFNGRFYERVPMPYRLLSPFVFVRWMREPDRFNVFLALPVSVLAAHGMAEWLRNRRPLGRWPSLLLPGALGALVLAEYLITPVPTHRNVTAETPFYSQIAREPGEFALLDIPLNPLEAKGYMFAQTVHQRPIVMGRIARRYEGLFAYIDGNPLLSALHATDEIPHTLNDVSRQLAVLASDGIRYVILHKTWAGADRVAHWQRYLLIRPLYEDERVAIYTTSPQVGRDVALAGELVPGLGPITVLLSADCLNPGRVLEVAVGWGSSRALDQDFDVTLSLADGRGSIRHAERFPLAADWPTSQWPAHAIAWEFYTLHLPPSLPEGEHRLLLSLQRSGAGDAPGEALPVYPLTVQREICNLATLPEARDVNAIFGDSLRLAEYEIRQDEGTLDLWLYWRAERWIDTDFKFFVHVADPATGIPVAQNDAMPHSGANPTTSWWPGEVVNDRVSISLRGVPPGRYDIAVGIYEPATGERLPLVNRRGQVVPDGRLLLEDGIEVR